MRFVLIPMLCSMLLIGCAPAEEPAVGHQPANSSVEQDYPRDKTASPVQRIKAQMIIKFKADMDGSQVSSRLEQMGRDYSVVFRLLREMSGDAFVIEATEVADEKRLNALLELIRKRDDVEYIEMDARMSHQ